MIYFEKGNLVNHNGTTFRFRRMATDNQTAICEHVATQRLEEIPLSELRQSISQEDTDQDFVDNALLPIESFTNEQQKQADQRFNIIKDLLDTPVDQEKIKRVAEENNVGISTIYKWRSRYLKTGFTQSLIDREGRGGKGSERLPADINEIVKECIELYYLKQKKSLSKTLKEIQLLCEKEKLKVPSINTIKNRVRNIPESVLSTYRRGRKKSKELYEGKTGTIPGADYPYSLVQIDHTRLDIVLVDEIDRLVLGRPWLTLLIDVCTRIPIGRYLSLDAPGNYGTGQAIAMGLFPKDKLLARHNLDSTWPVWGPIKVLHCDNAGEFHSEMLKQACMGYGITLQFRKIGTPHYGAHIERFLGTFNKEVHDLPGTTFSNTHQRKFYDYDSEKLAAFTLQEFDEWLVTFITKVYMQRNHEGLGMAPIKKLEQFILGSDTIAPIGIQPMYPDFDRLKLDFLPFVERTIQTYGVEIDNFRYYDPVISPFINAKTDTQFSKQRAKKKFIFKIDPNNLNRAYFLHPETGEYFQIPQSDLAAPPITKWEKREIEKNLKALGKEVNQAEIISGYHRMNEIEEAAVAKTKKARRRNHRRKVTTENTVDLASADSSETVPQETSIDYARIKTFEVDHDSFT